MDQTDLFITGVTALSLSLYLKYKDMTFEIIEALKETKQAGDKLNSVQLLVMF